MIESEPRFIIIIRETLYTFIDIHHNYVGLGVGGVGGSREKMFFLSLYQYSMEDSKTLAGSVCRPCRCHRSEGLFAIFYSPIFARRLRLADDTPRSLLPSSSTDKWLHFTVLTQRLFFIQAIDSIISVDPMQTEPSP